MKNKTKTIKRAPHGTRTFEERCFNGSVMARFMSQKEQDEFMDNYNNNRFMHRVALMKPPTKEDFAISKQYADGKYVGQISREMGLTYAVVSGAIDRVARHMLRLDNIANKKK